MVPHQGIFWSFAFSFDHPTSKNLIWSFGKGWKLWGTLTCICCKVKSWTTPERSVILLDQNSASVWNFWWKYTPQFDRISFSSFCFETWLAFFPYEPSCAHHHFFNAFGTFIVSLSFFLYFGTFMCPILFQSFCIALLSLSKNMLERSYFRACSIYFAGDEKHVLVYSQCRNSWLFVACMWVLILGAWNISQRGHKTWSNSTQRKRHIWKVLSRKIIYGLGWYLNVIQGTCYLNFVL